MKTIYCKMYSQQVDLMVTKQLLAILGEFIP